MKRLLIAAALVAAVPGLAQAYGSSTREVDRRQLNQEIRIERGLRDGTLTRFEAARLKAEQDRIQRLEYEARRDGYVSAAERDRLRAAQNSASRNIYLERHDYESRGPNRRWWSWQAHRHEELRRHRWW